MSPWRVEMLRVWCTRRLVALVTVFVLFGLGIPVLTYYLPEIVRHANTGGVQIILPRQTPPTRSSASARTQPNSARSWSWSSPRPAWPSTPAPFVAFYRTRARRASLLLLPRHVVVAAAAASSLRARDPRRLAALSEVGDHDDNAGIPLRR